MRQTISCGWYKAVIADISEDAGQKAISDLDSYAGNVIFIQTDISDRLEVHNLVAETLSIFGNIDLLVNNAGIAVKGGLLDLSEEDFANVLSVNLYGSFMAAKMVAKHMVEEIENLEDRSRLNQKPFSIVNMSSINDRVVIQNYLSYVVSKGALQQLTKAMALELAPYGIRVNAIGPGSVKTDMLSGVNSDEEAMKILISRTPLGRPAMPDEIASVAAFLASDDASYITGETIYVDGGRLALNYVMDPKEEV